MLSPIRKGRFMAVHLPGIREKLQRPLYGGQALGSKCSDVCGQSLLRTMEKNRAAGNPLYAGGSQGPLLLPKVEDTRKVGHVRDQCKSVFQSHLWRNIYDLN